MLSAQNGDGQVTFEELYAHLGYYPAVLEFISESEITFAPNPAEVSLCLLLLLPATPSLNEWPLHHSQARANNAKKTMTKDAMFTTAGSSRLHSREGTAAGQSRDRGNRSSGKPLWESSIDDRDDSRADSIQPASLGEATLKELHLVGEFPPSPVQRSDDSIWARRASNSRGGSRKQAVRGQRSTMAGAAHR